LVGLIFGNDVHPELRRTARWLSLFLLSFTLRKFRVAKALRRFMQGRHSRALRFEQHEIPRPDGSCLRICVYAPLRRQSGVPGLLWMHGGGYAMGTPEQEERRIKSFVDLCGCVVVSPDYTLSLDAPYPAALLDCYAALLWLNAHGKEYGVRGDQLMVGGQSAGGGLAAAVALYARDKQEVAIAFQMLIYPMLDDRMNVAAGDNNTPLWNSSSNGTAWKQYLGTLYGSADVPVYAAPARAADLRGLPPACSYVGSIEPFHDETVDYMNKLSECGIPARLRIFNGCFHGFDIVCRNTTVAKEANAFLDDSFAFAVKNYTAKQPGT
jgi:acetyl esterase/lipase